MRLNVNTFLAFIAVLVSAFFRPAVADELQLNSYVEKANIAIPYYGAKLYGKRDVKLFSIGSNENWLVHQSRYGGDGEHTPNILMIFEAGEHGVNKLFQYNISDVTFNLKDGLLSHIDGQHIETLCDVCDGWEVSENQDIFKIPIRIQVPSLRIEVLLDEAAKQELISRLSRQVRHNVKEQFSYGNKYYAEFAQTTERAILNLVNTHNPSFKRDALKRAP